MSFFRKSFTDILSDVISDSIPSKTSSGLILPLTTTTTFPMYHTLRTTDVRETIKKIDTIFMDVDAEGEKRGYKRAAAEYDAAFERIESEYLKAKKLFDQQMANKDAEVSQLIAKLQQLEEEKKNLEHSVHKKIKLISNKYDIPISTVSLAFVSDRLPIEGPGLLDLIYRYKNKKLKEAEEKGYTAARCLYKKKISELMKNIELLEKKGDAELREMAELITDALKEITDTETKIAELEIILKS